MFQINSDADICRNNFNNRSLKFLNFSSIFGGFFKTILLGRFYLVEIPDAGLYSNYSLNVMPN